MKQYNVAVIVTAILASSVYSWGAPGHETIGTLAIKLVKNSTLERIDGLMKGDTDGLNAGRWSTWPDRVKSRGYQWSGNLHYADTKPWQCAFDPADCGTACITKALANFSNAMFDEKLDLVHRQEALKFTIHFAEDIHQPLHIGFKTDKGGNMLKGTFFGREGNLHSIWDTSIIQHTIAVNFQGNSIKYADSLLETAQKMKNQMKLGCDLPGDVMSCANAWASESSEIACKYVYTLPNGDHIQGGFALGEEYFKIAGPIVDEQIVKASIRLAALLDSLFVDPTTMTS